MKTTRSRYQQGSIAKITRANGFVWQVRFSEWRDGNRWQKCLTYRGDKYPTEAAVRKAIEHPVSLQNTDSARAKVDAPFRAIIGLYKAKHLPDLEPSTQQTNLYLLTRYIEPRFGSELIRDVKALSVVDWFGKLELAPTTKASIRSVMSVCFDLAALHQYIPPMEKNPMSLVRIKGVSKRKKKITQLTMKQFRDLVEALPEPLNLMALLSGCLGLRVSEMVALKWEDIDPTLQQIAIQRKFTHGNMGKTKSDASEAGLPLANSLLWILQQWKPSTKGSEWVFPSPRTGGPRSASMLLQKGLKPAAMRIGLGNVGWHTLRHACRSWLDSGKVQVGVQKDLLRQADITTTMNIYGRALPDDMRKSHNKMVKLLVPPTLLPPK
jgi:integrase